ncbi:MAG: NAD(+)/NADH kinase [Pseudomonadota bacterium]|nr:NAD(+)/NADH kinase [Pseudomonadota bacterium]
MSVFKTLALFVHPKMDFSYPVFDELNELAKKFGVSVVLCGPDESLMPVVPFPRMDVKDLPSNSLAVIMGGDGTFLHAATPLMGLDIPMIGIDFGTIGFLTDTSPKYAYITLQQVLEGQYNVEHRPYFLATVGETQFAFVNEVAVNRHPHERPLDFDIYVEGELVLQDYRGDGMIFASPTGSTGYSRSAAGAVMHPSLKAMIMTPVCAQSRAVRPHVLPDHFEIRMSLNAAGAQGGMLMFDGQAGPCSVLAGQALCVGKSPYTFPLVTTKELSYFERYHQKLT